MVQSSFKEMVHPKMKTVINLLALIQTHMTFFLQWNIKKEI